MKLDSETNCTSQTRVKRWPDKSYSKKQISQHQCCTLPTKASIILTILAVVCVYLGTK